MKQIRIGIDPGMNGGIAVLFADNSDPKLFKMPETIYDVRDMFQLILEDQFFCDVPAICFIEVPPWSMGENKGIGSVKLHHNRGVLEGMLVALGVKVVNITPQKWQKTFSLGTRSSCPNDNAWKNKLKAEAQRIYPTLKVTQAVADALLILTYGLRQLETKSHL